jgi:hypothetical protein
MRQIFISVNVLLLFYDKLTKGFTVVISPLLLLILKSAEPAPTNKQTNKQERALGIHLL